MSETQHWQAVYEKKVAEEVSWYRAHLERSLSFVRSCHLAADARIVDVGGGASTLVDDLLDQGYANLAVLDLAEAALQKTRERLAERAAGVDWIVGDATQALLPSLSVDFWHDRAVFHFLTDELDRAAYLEQATRCIKPRGYLLVATFGLNGPEQCSGLPVARYDRGNLYAQFASAFDKIGEATEVHETPWGSPQSFVYCLCQRRSSRRDA